MAERYIRVEDAHKLLSPYYGVDAPMFELIRCGDCKHYVCDDPTYCHCYLDGRGVDDNDYCSKAEEVDEVRNG